MAGLSLNRWGVLIGLNPWHLYQLSNSLVPIRAGCDTVTMGGVSVGYSTYYTALARDAFVQLCHIFGIGHFGMTIALYDMSCDERRVQLGSLIPSFQFGCLLCRRFYGVRLHDAGVCDQDIAPSQHGALADVAHQECTQ